MSAVTATDRQVARQIVGDGGASCPSLAHPRQGVMSVVPPLLSVRPRGPCNGGSPANRERGRPQRRSADRVARGSETAARSDRVLRYINAAHEACCEKLKIASRGMLMRNYRFDMNDGATLRNRVEEWFPTNSAAIEHGKQLARRFRGDPRIDDPNLYIRVIDESGAEVLREQILKLA